MGLVGNFCLMNYEFYRMVFINDRNIFGKFVLGTQKIFKRFEKLIYARIDLQLKIKLITYITGTDDLPKKLEKKQISGNFFFHKSK